MSIHSYLHSPGHLSSGPCARYWWHLAPYLPKVPRRSRDRGRARSLVCNLCWEGPTLSLWLCSHYLEILHFSTRGTHFHFELGPITYVGLSWGGETSRSYQCISDGAWSKSSRLSTLHPNGSLILTGLIPGSPGKCELSCFPALQLHVFLSRGIYHIWH